MGIFLPKLTLDNVPLAATGFGIYSQEKFVDPTKTSIKVKFIEPCRL